MHKRVDEQLLNLRSWLPKGTFGILEILQTAKFLYHDSTKVQ